MAYYLLPIEARDFVSMAFHTFLLLSKDSMAMRTWGLERPVAFCVAGLQILGRAFCSISRLQSALTLQDCGLQGIVVMAVWSMQEWKELVGGICELARSSSGRGRRIWLFESDPKSRIHQ